MRLAIAAVSTATLFAVARPAAAECGIARWIGTSSGVAIPDYGSLYVFDHSLSYGSTPYQDWIVTSDGTVLYHLEKVNDQVGQIRYWTKDATWLNVEVDDGWVSTRFPIDRAWRAPAADPRAVHYWHEHHEWTCSETDLLAIQIDQPAAAFRVRWRGLGQAGEWIVPARPRNDRGAPDGWWRDVLGIGKPDCASPTVLPSDLREGGLLEVTAIRFDGSEAPVAGLPGFISTADLATLDGDAAMAQPPPPSSPVVADRSADRMWLAIVLAPIVLLLALAAFLAGRRRAIVVVQ